MILFVSFFYSLTITSTMLLAYFFYLLRVYVAYVVCARIVCACVSVCLCVVSVCRSGYYGTGATVLVLNYSMKTCSTARDVFGGFAPTGY